MKFRSISVLALSLVPMLGEAFNYELTSDMSGSVGSIFLTDEETGITDLKTIFKDDVTLVSVVDLEWTQKENFTGPVLNATLNWITFVDDVEQDSGSILLNVDRELPTSVDAGSVKITKKGRATITVSLTVDNDDSNSGYAKDEYSVYGRGASIVPLIVVLVLAMTTRMVEFSLFCGIFVGACMVEGEINNGFKTTLDTYILGALADVDHVYVILFTLFLSGLVGMMQKSGGMSGFTRDVSRIAKTPRLGQLACFLVGCFVFFDDYANVLLAGETMRPLLDLLHVSREKLAFIVDATAAPVASISPVSSWVGFEVGLIQDELDKIIEKEAEAQGTDDPVLSIKESGFGVFLQSIKYRYYPIHMIVLMALMIYSGRDWLGMLVAERKVRAYNRTDGGDGKGRGSELEGKDENQPRKDTPQKSWNLVVPVLVLIFLIFWLLVETGTEEGEDQDFMDKIENSDSYAALLWGTMGTVILTLLFYLVQIIEDGELVKPRGYFPALGQLMSPMLRPFRCLWAPIKRRFEHDSPMLQRFEEGDGQRDDEDDEAGPRTLMGVFDSTESFLYGLGRIFPALIVLTLAWASGAIMVAVGADRLFSSWIVGGIPQEWLPTLSFIISFFMALATGTSWGTMTILFPLILVPTYDVSGGDETIFYATVAGVLSGSVAGDHVSPISDTTVLSALACDCNLMAHVKTQAPYALIVTIVSVLVGTIPIGFDAWPNMVGIAIGWVLIGLFMYLVCRPVINATGRFDPLTELVIRFKGDDCPLHQLRDDTVKAYNGDELDEPEDEKELMDDEMIKETEREKTERDDTGREVEKEQSPPSEDFSDEDVQTVDA